MTTAFVLSGGGSLGAVQVGMLQALAARGIEPDLLVGTSAGATNAAWVADRGMSGESLDELATVWSTLRRRDIFPVDGPHLLRALSGRTPALCPDNGLRHLVASHTRIRDLDEACVPAHFVATDASSGEDVLLSHGPVTTAVLASAAVPGVLPPVLHQGRLLFDGGVAPATGVSAAVELGADVVYVLAGGSACALPHPPRTAIGMALHAMTLLIQQRLAHDVRLWRGAAQIKVLPPLCPLAVSPGSFKHAPELVVRGRDSTGRWLDAGRTELPDQERFLALHSHPAPPAAEAGYSRAAATT